MPRSALVQSRLDCPVNLINNGKSRWLMAAAALFAWGPIAVLLRRVQPLSGCCQQVSCAAVCPSSRAGGGSGGNRVTFSCQPFPRVPRLLL